MKRPDPKTVYKVRWGNRQSRNYRHKWTAYLIATLTNGTLETQTYRFY